MIQPILRVCLVLLVVSGLGACATMQSFPGPSSYPAKWEWTLRASADAPEVRELLKLFYSAPEYNDTLRTQVAKLLQSHPHHGDAHDMAAVLGMLDGRPDVAWWHWSQAARDTNWPYTAYALGRLRTLDLSVRQKQEMINLCEHLAGKHPSGEVRSRALDMAGAYYFQLGDLEKSIDAYAKLGYVRDWSLLGVLDNDQGKGFFTPFAPEKKVDLASEEKGILHAIKWRNQTSNSHSGRVYLSQYMSPSRQALAYMTTWFNSARDDKIQLRISTSDPIRVWVNNTLVVSEQHISGYHFDNVVVTVPVNQGENHLLIKSANQKGSWTVGVRATDLEGDALRNLAFRTAPQLQNHGEATQSTVGRAIGLKFESQTGTLRDPIVQIYTLLEQGYWKDAVEVAQLLNTPSINSIAAIQAMADAFLVNGEEGKTIDLINRAISQTNHSLPGLLSKRANFYASRDREDKAQQDLLDAYEAQPQSAWLALELADHFSGRGWYVDACRLAKEATERAPDLARGHYALATCLQEMGYEKKARQEYQRAHHLEKGSLSYVRRLYHKSKQSLDYSAARKYALWENNLVPQSISPKLKMAVLERIMGNTAASEKWLEKMVAQDPDFARPYREKAIMAHERGEQEAAIGLFKEALSRDPDNTALADLIEYMEPQGLGWMEAWVPQDDQIQRAIQRAPQVDVMPGSHFVTLLDDEVAEVANDGSAKRVVTQVNMAVTKTGRDQMIRAYLPYAGKTRLLKAYAIQPDGARQEASSIRGSNIRFRKVEKGTVVVVQYVHYAMPAQFMPNEYFASWFFQGTGNQVEKSRWVLAFDEKRHLNIKIQGDVKHQKKNEGNQQVHIFSAEGVAPLVPEQFMPPVRDLVNRVSLSTVKSWDEYVAWEKALLSTVFREEPRLRQLAMEITAGTNTKKEALDRLYHYATQEIRYQQDYENTIAGVKPHACPVVLERGYGDCKDKAVLLILLAKQMGIKLNFAILRTTNAGAVEVEVPNQQFNHAIVHVPEQEGFESGFFLDPTTDGLDLGVLRNDDQGATSLVLNPETGKWAFIPIPYQNASEQWEYYNVSIDIEGAKAAEAIMDLQVRGLGASKIRKVLRSQEQAEKFYAILASQIFPGASLKDASAENHTDIVSPLSLKLEADVTTSLQQKERGWRFQLPNIFPLRQLVNLEKRTTPLRIGPPSHMKQRIQVNIPSGHRVTSVPENIKVNHGCFDVTRTTKKSAQTVDIDFHLVRRCVEVSPEEYSEFRAAVLKVLQQMQESIDFERGR